jgi:hypothetical protein
MQPVKGKRRLTRTTPQPIRLNERDIAIVEAVYRFRVLSQRQLELLFFSKQQHASRRLEKLFDHGYLERKVLPRSIGEGRSPTLYILDRLGAELLRTERGYDQIKWFNTSKDLTSQYLSHMLAVNDVMAAISLACHREGFQLTSWIGEQELKADFDRVTLRGKGGEKRSISLIPDAVFTIVAHNRLHRCLLELDRGTKEVDRYKEKIRAFIEYHESGAYEKRYKSKSMRVITVISTRYSGEKRLQSLKKATEEAGGKRRYWFTTLGRVTPETVLNDPIWHVAGDSEQYPLIAATSTD